MEEEQPLAEHPAGKSVPQPLEQIGFGLQLLSGIVVKIDMAGKEIFGLDAGKTKQMANIKLSKLARPVTLDGEGFQRLTSGIGMPRDVLWEFDGDLHAFRIAGFCA